MSKSFNLLEITDPSFLKNLSTQEMNQLALDIRSFLISSISKTGGHLSSNLGIVELTIALHRVFQSPTDKIFFDVGHQCYVHKILTGRANQFDTLRQFNGLSGFQKQAESIHDVWEAGHSSTALSAATGMAIARDLDHASYHIVPVIGDGAIVSGESLEALNHLGGMKEKVIVVLNDNQMSISKNVGGLSEALSDIRVSSTYNKAKSSYRNIMSHSNIGKEIYDLTSFAKNKIRDTVLGHSIFSEFGLDYIGPIDGHNIKELIKALEKAKSVPKSVVVHVMTKKGKGYEFAENDSEGKWHGVGAFDVATGKPLASKEGISWSKYVANEVEDLMSQDDQIVTITPAMISGSELKSIFKHYPTRAIDTGIAEEHAMTLAAGLAISNKKPFLSIYSSFMQRAYDQLLHDITRMNLHVVVGIDRCGLAEGDGETHHGIYDLSYTRDLINTTLFAPSTKEEIHWFLEEAFKKDTGLYMLRYPKGEAISKNIDIANYAMCKWQVAYEPENPKAIVISYGAALNRIETPIKDQALPYTLINACFIDPLDEAMIKSLPSHLPIIVYETDMKRGGLYNRICLYLNEQNIKTSIHGFGLPSTLIVQGNKEKIYEMYGLDVPTFIQSIEEIIHG